MLLGLFWKWEAALPRYPAETKVSGRPHPNRCPAQDLDTRTPDQPQGLKRGATTLGAKTHPSFRQKKRGPQHAKQSKNKNKTATLGQETARAHRRYPAITTTTPAVPPVAGNKAQTGLFCPAAKPSFRARPRWRGAPFPGRGGTGMKEAAKSRGAKHQRDERKQHAAGRVLPGSDKEKRFLKTPRFPSSGKNREVGLETSGRKYGKRYQRLEK